MAHFGKVEYWNTRYNATREVEPFHEWYQNFASLRHFLTSEFLSPSVAAAKTPFHPPNLVAAAAAATSSQSQPVTFPDRSSCRVLILGCGNSRFGEEMLRDGWKGGIINVDFSQVVVDHMKTKYNDSFYQQLGLHNNRKKPYLEFVCADITKGLGFYQDGSFDLIICKATLDAILSSVGSVANAKLVVHECNRLLADNHGIFMLVTFGNPDSRVAFLEHQGDLSPYWQGVSVHAVPRVTANGKEHPSMPAKKDYVYICRKRASSQEAPTSPFAPLTRRNEEQSDGEENRPAAAVGKKSFTSRCG